jgi:hypothetical protein
MPRGEQLGVGIDLQGHAARVAGSGMAGPTAGSASQMPRVASQIRTSRVSWPSVSAHAPAPVRGAG